MPSARPLSPGARRPLRAALAAVGLASASVAAAHLWVERALLPRCRDLADRALRQRLPQARLGGAAGLDWQGRIALGPLEIPSRRPGAPAWLSAREIRVRPRWSALALGRLEPDAIALAGVRIEPGPDGPALRALLDGPPQAARRADGPRRAAALPEIRIEDAIIAVDRQPVAIGPLAARLAVDPGDPGAIRADVSLDAASLSLHGLLRWDPAKRRLALEQAHLDLGRSGDIRLHLWGELELDPEPRFAAAARLEPTEIATLLGALPPALLPAETPRPPGPVAARLAAAGPLHRPAEWALRADLDLSAARRAAREGGGTFLQGPFTWRPPSEEGQAREIRIGPDNPSFVPLAELPEHVVRAITTSEDAGFFAHQGFDLDEIRNALAAGAGARRLRGASTITQQLARNLYLSPERTLARKVREALLTVALEASLSKARILEIYLNLVDWGPGIRGIEEAARAWFGKEARALSPREAAFLATVLPNPSRARALLAHRELPEAWRERVDDLLLKMRDAGQLSDEQLREALDSPLSLGNG